MNEQANLMSGRAAKVASLVALGIGAASWVYVGHVIKRREPWDDPVYFSTVLPALCVVAAILGVLVPEKPWRWGLLLLGGQAAAAFIQNPTGNLMPLGLIVFGIFGALCSVPAYVGAAVRRFLINRS